MKKSIQLVALLLTVVMGSCTGGKDKAATEHVVEKPKVKVADVKARPVDQIQEYTATVEAEAKNNIAPSSPVRIDQIFVEVGDRVSKGQKLVQMDAANLKQNSTVWTNCTRSAVHPNQNGMLRKCSSTYSAQPIRICWKTLL